MEPTADACVAVFVQVSSDGRYLAAGGVDRSIHVWDVRAHQYLRAFSGHRGTVSVSSGPFRRDPHDYASEREL